MPPLRTRGVRKKKKNQHQTLPRMQIVMSLEILSGSERIIKEYGETDRQRAKEQAEPNNNSCVAPDGQGDDAEALSRS